jgi:hypothetical protein
MIQALKDGKSFWFNHKADPWQAYTAKLQGEHIKVSWDQGQAFYAFDNGNCKCVNNWVCTKIEGEETMEKKQTPHKHAELIKKWADGAIIQYGTSHGEWIDCNGNKPLWDVENEYRVKPTLVKKWKWAYETLKGSMVVTCLHYSSPEEFYNLNPGTRGMILQKIYSTMQEVEE